MQSTIASLGEKIYKCHNHHGYIVKWSLISPLCKKWIGNRDPDTERVQEMIEYNNNGGYLPRTIHLAITEKDGLVCYDGNHRREVFDKCKNVTFVCIIDVLFNATQCDIYNAFNNTI